MALVHGYVTTAKLAAAVGDQEELDSPLYEMAIDAASRQIDSWCDARGRRHFWSTDAPVARQFHPYSAFKIDPGFISTTDGLVIKTDATGDGVFESTWSATDYKMQPNVRPNGEPYTRIVATGTRRFPVNGRAECVEITAKWGWTAIPQPVVQATQILAIAYYKSKDFTGGDMGFGESTGAAGDDIYSLARSLIERYQIEPTPVRQST